MPETIAYPDEIDISNPNPAPAAAETSDDTGWESPEATNQPAPKRTSIEEAGADDADGDSPDSDGDDGDDDDDDDAGWEESQPAATTKDDDDKDSKGRIPSWRVREIREQKDKEIEAARKEAQEAREELARVRSGASAKDQPAVDPAVAQDRERVIAVISERDPVIKDANAKLEAIQYLVENKPEELVNYFRNADHMAAEVAKLTSLRETRINAHLDRIETEHTNAEASRTKAQTDYVNKLVGDYDTAIKASTIPNITKYASRLAANASKLHVGIRELILHSDEKDVVTAAIGSNRALFDELAAIDPAKPLNPVQLSAIGIKLGKAVSAYTNKPRGSYVEEPEPVKQDVKPTAVRRAPRAGVPRYRTDKDGTILI